VVAGMPAFHVAADRLHERQGFYDLALLFGAAILLLHLNSIVSCAGITAIVQVPSSLAPFKSKFSVGSRSLLPNAR